MAKPPQPTTSNTNPSHYERPPPEWMSYMTHINFEHMNRMEAWAKAEEETQAKIQAAVKRMESNRINTDEWDRMDECPSPGYRSMPGFTRNYEILRPGRLSSRRIRHPPQRYPSPPGSPPPPVQLHPPSPPQPQRPASQTTLSPSTKPPSPRQPAVSLPSSSQQPSSPQQPAAQTTPSPSTKPPSPQQPAVSLPSSSQQPSSPQQPSSSQNPSPQTYLLHSSTPTKRKHAGEEDVQKEGRGDENPSTKSYMEARPLRKIRKTTDAWKRHKGKGNDDGSRRRPHTRSQAY